MKKSLSSFFLLLLIAAVFTSCEPCGNVARSEPTPADAAWLVYRENDSIRFKTETDDTTVVYTRSGIFADELPGEGYTATDECIEKINVEIRTLMEDEAGEHPSLHTRITSMPDNLRVELGVAEAFWEIDEQQPTHETHTVNGQVYDNVYEVVTNGTTANGVRRILFNQEYGFLSVEFNNGRKLEIMPE